LARLACSASMRASCRLAASASRWVRRCCRARTWRTTTTANSSVSSDWKIVSPIAMPFCRRTASLRSATWSAMSRLACRASSWISTDSGAMPSANWRQKPGSIGGVASGPMSWSVRSTKACTRAITSRWAGSSTDSDSVRSGSTRLMRLTNTS